MRVQKLAQRIALGIALATGLVAVALVVGMATAGPFDPWELMPALALCGSLGLLGGLAAWSRLAGGLFATVALVELLLQLLAAGTLIPMVCVVENAPLGRVYWMAEGRNASHMNRAGWHYPRMAFSDAATRRIAIVGDSFVEGLEIDPRDNMGQVLEQQTPAATEVMAFGRGKTGPGHYLETVRYVVDRHQPDDIVVLFFLGNDFTDSMAPERNAEMPGGGHEIYYAIESGRLVVDPKSPLTPARYRARLEANDGRYPVNLARSLASWFMLPEVVHNLVRHAQAVALFPELRSGGVIDEMGLPVQRISSRAQLRVVTALLGQLAAEARAAGATLTLVTVPHFPASYYQEQANRADYGLFSDEAQLVQALQAARVDMQLLPLGARIRELGIGLDELRALYLLDGSGHFSAAGHRFCAEQIHAVLAAGDGAP